MGNLEFETQLVHGATTEVDHDGAANVPIYLTTTFRRSGISEEQPFGQARFENPSKESLRAP